jgi:hypothetical protein
MAVFWVKIAKHLCHFLSKIIPSTFLRHEVERETDHGSGQKWGRLHSAPAQGNAISFRTAFQGENFRRNRSVRAVPFPYIGAHIV